jgi:hypothetical protein
MFYDTSSCIKRVMVVLVLTLTAIVIGTPARLRTIAPGIQLQSL